MMELSDSTVKKKLAPSIDSLAVLGDIAPMAFMKLPMLCFGIGRLLPLMDILLR